MGTTINDVERVVRKAHANGFKAGYDAGAIAGRNVVRRERIETLIVIGAIGVIVGVLAGLSMAGAL